MKPACAPDEPLLLVVVAVLLAACGGSGTEPNPLAATPAAVVFSDFGMNPAALDVNVATTGTSASWTVAPADNWVTVSATSGAGLPATFTVNGVANGKVGGIHYSSLTFVSPAYPALTIPVSMYVPLASGTFSGMIQAVNTLSLTLTETSGSITGTGTLTRPGQPTLSLTVTGAHVSHPTVTLSITAPGSAGSATMNFSTARAMNGSVTGLVVSGQVQLARP